MSGGVTGAVAGMTNEQHIQFILWDRVLRAIEKLSDQEWTAFMNWREEQASQWKDPNERHSE